MYMYIWRFGIGLPYNVHACIYIYIYIYERKAVVKADSQIFWLHGASKVTILFL